jgi:bleomycin hydrolase
MKRLYTGLLLIATLLMGGNISAQLLQTDSILSYVITQKKVVETTAVKNQYRSGTCWAFASISFFEAEILRIKGLRTDLSEMFIVRNAYLDHAEQYVQVMGKTNFSAGAEGWDAVNVISKYGILPDKIYPGLNYGEDKHIHGELDHVLKSTVDAVLENKNKKLSPAWAKAYNGILDAYFGALPEFVAMEDTKMTAKEYASLMGIDMSNYIPITSFLNKPFYTKYVFQSPDNWSAGLVYNLPIEQLVETMKHALDNNYSIAWAADVSDDGFLYNEGIAINPDQEQMSLDGLEMARWQKMGAAGRHSKLLEAAEKSPVSEKNVTQEIRQRDYMNLQTTDDHLMHINGYATDQDGNLFFLVKNSWGTGNALEGYFYASESYIKMRTMTIMLHKDALSSEMQQKLKL